jgi:hypothetical protein
VAYLRQKSGVNFRLTEVDAGKLKHKYLNRPWSTLAVKVLRMSGPIRLFPLYVVIAGKEQLRLYLWHKYIHSFDMAVMLTVV